MIIDSENEEFYALSFSKYEYNNHLHLIKGSLVEPTIIEDSKSIPFSFHDIMSYVDLIYSKSQQKLYAITAFRSDNGITDIQIHSILFPPNVNVDQQGTENMKAIEIEQSEGFNFILNFIVITTLHSLS